MEIVVRHRTRRTGWARVVSALSSALLVALLLVSVGYLVPPLLGYERYVITGGSMTGTYDKGSIVFERAVPNDQLAVGDVITYLPPADSGVTTLVTHRIIKVRDTKDGRVFRTQGDYNPDKDPWTFTLDHGSQPVVDFSVPHVGWVFLFLADPRHRMWAIGGPAAAVAILSLVQAATNARKIHAQAKPVAAPVAGAAPQEPVAVPVTARTPVLAAAG